MRTFFAIVRATWLSASSYKVRSVLSFIGVLTGIVPLYFVSHALQPMMANVIRGEGHQYFAFLLLGTITFSFLPIAVSSLPTTVGSSIGNGTLEAVVGSPTSVGTLIAGLMGYSVMWTIARALVLLLAGALLGAALDWHHAPLGLGILALIFVVHIPLGLIAAAAVLAFRTPGPFPQGVLVLSSLLGGVYYPTHVIPSWLERLSALFPLTYGLRALRRVMLDGQSIGAVYKDLGFLILFIAVLFAIGLVAFSQALDYARRRGTLSNY